MVCDDFRECFRHCETEHGTAVQSKSHMYSLNLKRVLALQAFASERSVRCLNHEQRARFNVNNEQPSDELDKRIEERRLRAPISWNLSN